MSCGAECPDTGPRSGPVARRIERTHAVSVRGPVACRCEGTDAGRCDGLTGVGAIGLALVGANELTRVGASALIRRSVRADSRVSVRDAVAWRCGGSDAGPGGATS